MRQIVIGKEGNQPFTIVDEYVSRQHAVFTFDEVTGVMTLTDRSSNGTFVRIGSQYQQISQCNVDVATDVRLGPYYTFRIGQLFQTQPPKPKSAPSQPKVEKVDIVYLRKVAENYEATKTILEQQETTANNLRTLSTVFMSLGGVCGTFVTLSIDGRNKWVAPVITISIVVIGIVSLITYCNKRLNTIRRKKKGNEKNYKISFCCPKCHVPFAGKLYENILAEGKCPKCKTEFYDSKI